MRALAETRSPDGIGGLHLLARASTRNEGPGALLIDGADRDYRMMWGEELQVAVC